MVASTCLYIIVNNLTKPKKHCWDILYANVITNKHHLENVTQNVGLNEKLYTLWQTFQPKCITKIKYYTHWKFLKNRRIKLKKLHLGKHSSKKNIETNFFKKNYIWWTFLKNMWDEMKNFNTCSTFWSPKCGNQMKT